jgi:chromosome segregation ATPase
MLPIADFTPLSPSAQVAVVSVLGVIAVVVGIWVAVRRRPPLDTELEKLNSAIAGLQKAVDALTKTAGEHAHHATEIQALKSKVTTLEEHREKDLHAQRTYTRESTQRIFDRLDELKDSFNSNFQAVERAMGQLEGKVSVFLEGARN